MTVNEPCFPLLSLARLRMGTDGTGVTTLAAGAGCPLHCRWCINKRLLTEAPAVEVTASALIDRVMVDDLYFRATGGGITFGGGEPLLHASFISRFRQLCPAQWKIFVETSLAVPRAQVCEAAESVDSFIVDCKDMNRGIYSRYTGGDASLMEENLLFLADQVGPERILVRVPLIPEYNTRSDQEQSIAKLRAMGITRIDAFDYVIRQ